MDFQKGLLVDPDLKDEVVRYLKEKHPNYIQAVLDQAQRALRHEFNLLGSGWMDLGAYTKAHGYRTMLPWHDDFKIGYHYDERFPGDKIPQKPAACLDWKVPTELNRFMHLLPLGQAYWFTDDESFAVEIISEIENFIETNPWPYGVAWTCAMDVGMRAANWIAVIPFISGSKTFTALFNERLQKSLRDHAKYIMENLENWEIKPPHPI